MSLQPPHFFFFIVDEVFETSARVCVCGSERDRGNTDCFPEPASLQFLDAYLPNPSSVAKDLLPRVTPSHCHLGNRCRGELPAGIANLRLAAFHGAAVRITATGCTVCGWTDMRVCGGKLREQTYVMRFQSSKHN